MDTTVIVVQHGEKRKEPGDPGLTVRGERQAAACARALGDRPVAAVYSSPLRRALDTARAIAPLLGTSVIVVPALRERMNWSPDCGLDLTAFLSEWERATADRTYQPAVGDSSGTAGDRFVTFLEHLITTHPGGTVVTVSHGGVTTDMLRTLLGDAALEGTGAIEYGVPGGAMTELTHGVSGWRAVHVAGTEHIDPDDRTGHRRDG